MAVVLGTVFGLAAVSGLAGPAQAVNPETPASVLLSDLAAPMETMALDMPTSMLLSDLSAPVQTVNEMPVGTLPYTEECQVAYRSVQDRFMDGEFATLQEVGDALATVSGDCHLARSSIAMYRPGITYCVSKPSCGGIIVLAFCGEYNAYQVNTYSYATGTQTLFQAPVNPLLAGITAALNDVYASGAAVALAEGKAAHPVGLQNLEVTPVVEGGILLLRYAVPAAGFDHSLAATNDLIAAGPLDLVSDAGVFQLISPPDAAIAGFHGLSSLATGLNEAFAALAADAGFVPGDIRAEFSPAGMTLVAD